MNSSGTCILNAFNPYAKWETISFDWAEPVEELEWQVPYKDGTLYRYCRRSRVDTHNMVLYPDLIYRLKKDGNLVEEAVLSIAMRCHYPESFEALIKGHKFQIQGKWGGYNGQVYGEGPELVIQFGQ
jgi:hypothetical protein